MKDECGGAVVADAEAGRVGEVFVKRQVVPLIFRFGCARGLVSSYISFLVQLLYKASKEENLKFESAVILKFDRN